MKTKKKKKRLLNPKAKGSRIERKIKSILEKQGYLVSKAGGSLGMFDLTAVGRYDVLLIQAKGGNANISKAEHQVLRALEVGPFVKKLLYRWPDRAKEPIVENLGQVGASGPQSMQDVVYLSLGGRGLQLESQPKCQHRPHGDNCKAWPWLQEKCKCGSWIQDKGDCSCR